MRRMLQRRSVYQRREEFEKVRKQDISSNGKVIDSASSVIVLIGLQFVP